MVLMRSQKHQRLPFKLVSNFIFPVTLGKLLSKYFQMTF